MKNNCMKYRILQICTIPLIFLLASNSLKALNNPAFNEQCEVSPGYNGFKLICTKDLRFYGYAHDQATGTCRAFYGPGYCWAIDNSPVIFTHAPFISLEECQLTCENAQEF